MRLYPRNEGVTTVDADGGHYEAQADGAFELPEHIAAHLRTIAVRGRKLWETAIERQRRLIREETERRKDPATLLAAVEQLVEAAKSTKPAETDKPSETSTDDDETETGETDPAE